MQDSTHKRRPVVIILLLIFLVYGFLWKAITRATTYALFPFYTCCGRKACVLGFRCCMVCCVRPHTCAVLSSPSRLSLIALHAFYLDVLVHASDPRIRQPEKGKSQGQGHPRLRCESLSPKGGERGGRVSVRGSCLVCSNHNCKCS